MELSDVLKEVVKNVKLVASDCDGVLTDGGLYYSNSGDEFKRFNVIDGIGFLQLKQNGIRTAIITAEDNHIVKERATRLKVDFLITGTQDKLGALNTICKELGISLKETAYIGDDSFDVPAIVACGFGCVPMSANAYIREKGDYITEKAGGYGAFREIADLVLLAKHQEYSTGL